LFQSVNVLASYRATQTFTPHDYADDLESFFYVYVYLLACYHKNGERRSAIVFDGVGRWKSDDPMASLDSKASFLARRLPIPFKQDIVNTWGLPFLELLQALRDLVNEMQEERQAIICDSGHQDLTKVEKYYQQADHYFCEFLRQFCDTIEKLVPEGATVEVECPGEETGMCTPTSPRTRIPPISPCRTDGHVIPPDLFYPASPSRGVKRQAGGSPDDQGSPKRKKTSQAQRWDVSQTAESPLGYIVEGPVANISGSDTEDEGGENVIRKLTFD
jgi:hypothetical protein